MFDPQLDTALSSSWSAVSSSRETNTGRVSRNFLLLFLFLIFDTRTAVSRAVQNSNGLDRQMRFERLSLSHSPAHGALYAFT